MAVSINWLLPALEGGPTEPPSRSLAQDSASGAWAQLTIFKLSLETGSWECLGALRGDSAKTANFVRIAPPSALCKAAG